MQRIDSIRTVLNALEIIEELIEMDAQQFNKLVGDLDEAALGSLRDGIGILGANQFSNFEGNLDAAAEELFAFVSLYNSNYGTLGVIGKNWPTEWPQNKSWIECALDNGIRLPANTLVYIKGLLIIVNEELKRKPGNNAEFNSKT